MKAEFKFRQFPPIAGELFEREMTFRSFNNSLDRTVQGYNRLKTNTTRVEYDLIKDQLDEIDVKLNDAENLLNWNSDGKNFELRGHPHMISDFFGPFLTYLPTHIRF